MVTVHLSRSHSAPTAIKCTVTGIWSHMPLQKIQRKIPVENRQRAYLMIGLLTFCELVAAATGQWLVVVQTLALFGSIFGYLIFSDLSYGMKYSDNVLCYRRYGAENLLNSGWQEIEFENIKSIFVSHDEDMFLISENEIENLEVRFDIGDNFIIKTAFFEEGDLKSFIEHFNKIRPGVIPFEVAQAFVD